MNVISIPKGSVGCIRPRQGSEDLAKAGFEYAVLDLSLFCSPGELEALGRDSGSLKKPEQSKNLQISPYPTELRSAARPL